MARFPECRDLAVHPLINASAAQLLEPFCDGHQLHFTQAVSICKGEGKQPIHRHRAVWGNYLDHSIETQFSTIWAMTDFTKKTAQPSSFLVRTYGTRNGDRCQGSCKSRDDRRLGTTLQRHGISRRWFQRNRRQSDRCAHSLHVELVASGRKSVLVLSAQPSQRSDSRTQAFDGPRARRSSLGVLLNTRRPGRGLRALITVIIV